MLSLGTRFNIRTQSLPLGEQTEPTHSNAKSSESRSAIRQHLLNMHDWFQLILEIKKARKIYKLRISILAPATYFIPIDKPSRDYMRIRSCKRLEISFFL